MCVSGGLHMKNIIILISVLVAAVSSAVLFTAHSSAVKITDNSEFYSYLLECANSYQKEIDVTKYVKANGWTTSELSDSIKFFYMTEPGLFFVKQEMTIRYSESGSKYQVEFKYLYKESEIEKMRKKLRKAALDATEDITSDMTDAEKALSVHDYIIANCRYDQSHTKYSAYDCLVGGSSVCQGYSLAYIYVLRDILGIDCSVVLSDSQNHSWNYVKIDDNWYHTDLTLDDPTYYTLSDKPYDALGMVSHRNFLLNDSECRKSSELHSSWNTLGLPKSDGKEYSDIFCRSSNSYTHKIGDVWYYAELDSDSPGVNYKKSGDSTLYTNICTYNPKTGKSSVLKRVKSNWFLYRDADSGEKLTKKSWYIESYLKLARIGNTLYYNTASAVYRLNISTGKAKKIYTLKKTDCSIYGITAQDETKLRICYKKDNSYAEKYINLKIG